MSTATVVLPLESEACLDPSRVGAKAARLAAALRVGLPVVAGVVIPADVSESLLAEASRDVERVGVHAARLSIMSGTSPPLADLADTLSLLGDDLVVRSSSPLEDASEYAGAFASYVGVTPAESVTAVRGVWASALASHDMPRGGQLDTADEGTALQMAVLVQCQVHPSFSGTARVDGEGVVEIVAVAGSPAPLLAGWARGEAATVSVNSDVSGTGASLVGEQVLGEVANMARRVCAELSADLIEWAATDQGPILLQARRAARRSVTPVVRTTVDLPAAAAGVARLVHAFAGALGEELLLPILLPGVSPASRAPAPRPRHAVTHHMAGIAWAEAQKLAERLRGQVWAGDVMVAERLLAHMRGGAITEAVASFAGSPRVGITEVANLADNLRLVAQWLEETSMLSSPDDLWAVPLHEVEALISGRSQATPAERREHRRLALLRWEPTVYEAIQGTGSAVEGEPASGGIGAGPAVVIRGMPTSRTYTPRMVVVAPQPLPQLAPLMWGAAGLVTTGGGTSAHLIEVARSRGVPAVVGCDDELLSSLLMRDGDTASLVAVDGDSGRVVVNVPSALSH